MGVPAYVINFEELADYLSNYFSNGINVDVNNVDFSTVNVEHKLDEIAQLIQGIDYENLITSLDNLASKIDDLNHNYGIVGNQKIHGQMLIIPAAVNDYTVSINVSPNARITGITVSQSAWNYQDCWSLSANGVTLFDNVYTKEYGETKFFNSFYKMESGGSIDFLFHNHSGASKIVWVDFEVLEA